jgi:hypothetical protein
MAWSSSGCDAEAPELHGAKRIDRQTSPCEEPPEPRGRSPRPRSERSLGRQDQRPTTGFLIAPISRTTAIRWSEPWLAVWRQRMAPIVKEWIPRQTPELQALVAERRIALGEEQAQPFWADYFTDDFQFHYVGPELMAAGTLVWHELNSEAQVAHRYMATCSSDDPASRRRHRWTSRPLTSCREPCSGGGGGVVLERLDFCCRCRLKSRLSTPPCLEL